MRLHPALAMSLAVVACAGVGYAGARLGNDGVQGRIPNHPKPVIADLTPSELQAIAKAAGLNLPAHPTSLTLEPSRPTSPTFTTSLNCVGVDMPAPSTDMILLRSNEEDCAWVWMQNGDNSKYHRVSFKVAPYEGTFARLQVVGGKSTTDGYIANSGNGTVRTVDHPTIITLILPPGQNTASLNVLKVAGFGYMAITEVVVDEF